MAVIAVAPRTSAPGRLLTALSITGVIISMVIALRVATGWRPEFNLPFGHAAVAANGLSENRAAAIASQEAAAYLSATIGASHENGDGSTTAAVSVAGRPITFRDFGAVALTREHAQELVTSISTSVAFDQPRDFWVGTFEAPNAFSVSSGRYDGTAYVIVVFDDVSGKLLAASSGVRSPEQQARNQEPLPSYSDRLGAAR